LSGHELARFEAIAVYREGSANRFLSQRRIAQTNLRIADILVEHGDLAGALHICREEVLPIFERMGDVRSATVTKGKIATLLETQGDLDSALRIRQEEVLPSFAAANATAVNAFHAAALRSGGRDNGAPGLRPEYSPDYYAAFIIDPDGYRIEAYYGSGET
jgi:hypothetical protein